MRSGDLNPKNKYIGGIPMPIMKVNAIKKEEVMAISNSLIDELEALLKCPRNYFVLEVVANTFVMDGEVVEGLPRIEVYWFDRGQEVKDAFAQIVTKKVRQIGYENLDIIFFDLKEASYYENGEHF